MIWWNWKQKKDLMINSRTKGKVAELEVVNLFKNAGYKDSHRSQQFKGTKESADIIIPRLDKIYQFEVKRREQVGKLDEWLQKTDKEAGEEKIPVVIHRRNGEPWKVTLLLTDWITDIKGIYPPNE
jgi:Holliday junction resolvase